MPAVFLARFARMSVRSRSLLWSCVKTVLISIFAVGCTRPVDTADRSGAYASTEGSIMGSYYAMTAKCPGSHEAAFAAAVTELESLDAEMSTWKEDSTLMRLNRLPPGETMTVSPRLFRVLETAESVRVQSGGAFDVSVGALVNAWGFGARDTEDARHAPSADHVKRLLPSAGSGYRLYPPDTATRQTAETFIDLSALAPGYGTDLALQALIDAGCSDAMVDVSGEVRATGRNPEGEVWKIGIESPAVFQGGITGVLQLDERAVATSGDYRNYREVDGRRISHTIDPRDGYPIRHGLASVTVVMATAMEADAWATALNVLGPEAGLELAQRMEIPVYMLVRKPEGFDPVYTENMKPLMGLP